MPIPPSCRILLLLTMVPIVAVAGRRIPAAPLIASLTPTPQVELSAQETGSEGVTWEHGQHHQEYVSRAPPPSRKLFRGNVKVEDSIYGHRLLVGSAPPSCQGKCGSCVPCTPIHVSIGSSPVHAGSVTQQEYYPEVWRCKCGNKFFMP
ncbi:hypothetical protein M758_2G223700 [Ceratodon purpureus]|nr:hypothetical protein M758_2G223700 [Ceratodon purpureus]